MKLCSCGQPVAKHRSVCKDCFNRWRSKRGYWQEHDGITAAWLAAKSRSPRLGREFSITLDQVKTLLQQQDNLCAVTGLPFCETMNSPARPSIDRIDNSQGYTAGNIRIVLASVNMALGEWGLEHFLKIAGAAIKHDNEHLQTQSRTDAVDCHGAGWQAAYGAV